MAFFLHVQENSLKDLLFCLTTILKKHYRAMQVHVSCLIWMLPGHRLSALSLKKKVGKIKLDSLKSCTEPEC